REEYVDVLAEALTYLPPDTVIGRVTGDAPAEDLLAPEWSRKKLTVIDELNKLLYETNRWQGMYFSL
ncbi:MAG: TIGR01212 family radical SAM protein, partial [Clostridia bacterium]|nr:TIGR01212 family radical SAM protein [Clostridia bacterium]